MKDAPLPNKFVIDTDEVAFTKKQLCEVAGLNHKTLSNYFALQKLKLYSEEVKAGQTRWFYLTDVYMVALIYRLVGLTQDADWTVNAIESFVYFHLYRNHRTHVDLSKTIWEKECIAKDKADKAAGPGGDTKRRAVGDFGYQKGVLYQHPMFWTRDFENPWYLFVDVRDMEDKENPRISVVQSLGEWISTQVDCGHMINVTRVLLQVDANIQKMIEEEGLRELE